MKFNHDFKRGEFGESHREYKCGNINAAVDFIGESAMRVAIYKDGCEMLPTFTVNPGNEFMLGGRDKLSTADFAPGSPKVLETDDVDSFTLDCGVTAELDLHNFLLKYSAPDGRVIFEDRAPLAYNFEGEFGEETYHYISREKGEHIYGLGDKSGRLNKAGNAYRIETSDSMGYNAETSDPLYKHVPFYICENSAGCYGIYYDTSDASFVDLGREINNYYEPFKFFKTNDDCLVYYIFFGTKLSVLQQYARLCGRQAFPPKWSFDYCASTMAYTDAPDAENQMNAFLEKLGKLGLACEGFYLSSGYTSIGNQRCVFNWNHDKFPNPQAFIERFAQNGIHLIPNIKPAFLTDHPMYSEIAEKGLFVKDKSGKPFITQFWDGLGSYIDFTNPAGFDFWSRQVTEKLLDFGMDATWNDNNEFDIKDKDALAAGFGGGEVSASRIRPILTYLMAASSYTAQIKKRPNERPFLSTRSGSSALRRLAQTWSGDNFTSFNDLKYCHYVGLTMSLSGFFIYGHDLGGFSGDMPSEELLLRWMQHGVFEPRFTIHSWNEDGSATMPWSYPEAIGAAKEILAERHRLVPYFYNCAYDCVQNEIPMNAPLFLYYNDEEIDENSHSMMVGRNILATFILDEGERIAKAYLPKGEIWYLNDRAYMGGQTVEIDIPARGAVPYFVRGGSVVAENIGEYGFKKEEKLVFTVYPIESGSFKSSFFTDDGKSFDYLRGDCVLLKFTVECNESQVIVTYKNLGNTPFEPELRLTPGDCRELAVRRQ